MILILGSNNTFDHLNRIQYVDSLEKVYYLYTKNGKLTEAYERAYALGVQKVYLCNIYNYTDFLLILNQLRALDLKYIVPIDSLHTTKIMLSDGNETFLFAYLSEILSATFILTGAHANDFSTYDDFIKHYNMLYSQYDVVLKDKFSVALVANHLKESSYGNIDCACSLISAQIAEYPLLKCGETVFQIEKEDFFKPIVYFKNGLLHHPFTFSQKIEGNLVIKKLLYFLKEELDNLLDHYKGRFSTSQSIIQIHKMVEAYLSQFNTAYYQWYRLIDIVYENGNLSIEVEIMPFYAYDSISHIFKVKGRIYE